MSGAVIAHAESFGAELKRRREALGVTREALGEAAGISASTVRQIEAGSIKRPPLRRLEGFASVLGWPVASQLSVLGEG
jgi:transcriptional regulator with XRE-family HTH domain